MDEIFRPHRPYFPIGEKARHGQRACRPLDSLDIVVRLPVKIAAAAAPEEAVIGTRTEKSKDNTTVFPSYNLTPPIVSDAGV